MSKRSLVVAALTVLFSLPAMAAVQKTGSSDASFTGKGPAGFKLEGKTQELNLQDAGSTVKIIVPLANLKTGIDLRDQHMREKYLEVQKYPDAVLEVPWSAITLPEDGKSVSGKAQGKMTLHGKTKDVSFSYTVKRTGASYTASGSVPLNIKEFDIHVPNYLGVTVKPDIETQVAFGFTKS
jgi:polyisoprenoid-binding protein YceI